MWPEIPIALGIIKNPIIKFLSKILEKYAYNNSIKIIGLSEGMCDRIIQTGYKRIQFLTFQTDAILNFFKRARKFSTKKKLFKRR